jgi:hypothetical protein
VQNFDGIDVVVLAVVVRVGEAFISALTPAGWEKTSSSKVAWMWKED